MEMLNNLSMKYGLQVTRAEFPEIGGSYSKIRANG